MIHDELAHYKLLYTLYCVLAQTELENGYLKKSWEFIELAEGFINKYKDLPNKGLFYYVKSYWNLCSGENIVALRYINESIEFEKALIDDQFTAPSYILKAEILTKLGDTKQAYNIAYNVYNQSTSYIEDDHELHARILTELASSELKLGLVNDAEKHIEDGLKILLEHNHQILKNDKSKLKRSDDLAFLYMIKGDLEYKKGNHINALSVYKKVFEIFQKRFHTHELDCISEVLYKMAITCYKLKDHFAFRQLLEKQENWYGIEHYRTKELYKLMITS